MRSTVLETDLSVSFADGRAVLNHVCLRVPAGEIVGLVGQSGSGKTTLSMALLGLLPPKKATVQGSIVVDRQNITTLPERKLRQIRGRSISLIPQNPGTALTPRVRLERHFREAWLAHESHWDAKGKTRMVDLLRACDLPPDAEFLQRYPTQISIGQAQRVLISMALLHSPRVLIADEPTTALDLLTQREVLTLLRRVNEMSQMAILLISHDLQVVASLAHRIAVLHGGSIVENGPTRTVLSNPSHSYTRQLVEAIPRPELQ